MIEKINYWKKMKNELSVQNSVQNRELLGDYRIRCNIFLLTNKIVVDIDNITKEG